ncbi:nuclear transport factor 2 family protein [Acinetobacter shaoyimingii]|uniref:Nuclear transport factor 2 family protein n=1 Tax=Acinetobacter shaoyimingii TaxID=2715164 RepID=A0A6G8RXZ7_9GAMM|nr:nuclear transport factor 2 family protein [Acinetobacter shaoyimingii]NHB58645.1 nuclear transport factor 2 family protein [Acinetobacter shaoyimingii]QIO06777.1 nuclear transport factor 2 family protein [Acinetobacter shaoyimingii]
MKIQIDGDQHLAQEVLQQIQLWDNAIISTKINELLNQCSKDISMFDVSCQLNGIDEYKNEWQKFSPYFSEGMKISRRNVKLYASEELAILHCHSKVENVAMKDKGMMPWCRTTLCLQKQNNQWRVVHQHISMPIDMLTGKAVFLKDEPKLRMVI